LTYLDDYCSLAELKAQLRVTDTNDDTALAVVITAVSREIDQFCDTVFGLTGSAVERFYAYKGERIDGRQALRMNDLMTTTGLVVKVDTAGDATFAQTLTLSTDFDLWPWNAAADSKPWTHVVLRPQATAAFSYQYAFSPFAAVPYSTSPFPGRNVSITANWGWSTVPTEVKQACLIQASRIFARRNSPFGVAGSPELGSEVRLLAKLDPDVQLLLRRVTRMWGAV
jgi:hypothetical protein